MVPLTSTYCNLFKGWCPTKLDSEGNAIPGSRYLGRCFLETEEKQDSQQPGDSYVKGIVKTQGLGFFEPR